jgi:SAM-dependent methyltransferase
VLEIGCGGGYGYRILKASLKHYVGVDKTDVDSEEWTSDCADFFRVKVPSLHNIPSNIFDFVIVFQVIEHIPNDDLFLKEICRVLKKGGQLLLTTPNKKNSFTRNPWHIREYESSELLRKTIPHFSHIKLSGINPSENLKEYLDKHKAQVNKMLRWDIFKIEQWMPRHFLKLPYSIFNNMNKILMHNKHDELLNNISLDDFMLGEIAEHSLDLCIIAIK